MKRRILPFSGIVLGALLCGPLVQAQTQPQTKPGLAQQDSQHDSTQSAQADSAIEANVDGLTVGTYPALGCPGDSRRAAWYAQQNALLLEMIGEASSNPEAARLAEWQSEHHDHLTGSPIRIFEARIMALKSILDSTGQNR